MIGFNDEKIGKVWLNENYACNKIQFKEIIKDSEEKLKW